MSQPKIDYSKFDPEGDETSIALELAKQGFRTWPLVPQGVNLVPLASHPIKSAEQLATTDAAEIKKLYLTGKYFVGVLALTSDRRPIWFRCNGKTLTPVPRVQGLSSSIASPSAVQEISPPPRLDTAALRSALTNASADLAKREADVQKQRGGLGRAKAALIQKQDLELREDGLKQRRSAAEAEAFVDSDPEKVREIDLQLSAISSELKQLDLLSPASAVQTIGASLATANTKLLAAQEHYDVVAKQWLLKVEKPRLLKAFQKAIAAAQPAMSGLLAIEAYESSPYSVTFSKMFDKLKAALPDEAQPEWLSGGLSRFPGRSASSATIDHLLQEAMKNG